ncbi:MAG: ribulose-bisphosphate carboxylase large subunit family protein [Gammaproteobacteria bacterium]|nr:ribulose-bisphosphate carboxylase large subunit family protein [Gammaproteobacteria bacterium]MBU1468886.1 ribulose-bisphosphate carboxylase large subunit family protein [Gammaproteobacteria bacterium]MBU2024348.1 ribulose-bisphosphate carboxylase large subunit family protein [Gammaproteobacteria bacterium]MBU2239289.1 ribulose-bisphosphate carboxylase large subunit family protein [Gammaproteobacteria bacterium]MBU2320877.1 ribulose-bisphosphate carboxylase large subunit family protein [Gamm
MMDRFEVTYLIHSFISLAQVAEKICNDQTTGTFTKIPDISSRNVGCFSAEVISIEESFVSSLKQYRGRVIISYPIDLCGYDLSAIFTIACGGVSSIKVIERLKIADIQFTDQFVAHFQGPKFGIEGTYRKLGMSEGPVIGGILKPNIGITPADSANLVAQLVAADIDFIKDDEKLQSPPYSHVKDRIDAIMPVIDDWQQKSGKKVIYAFNICHSDIGEIERNHEYLKSKGGDAAVINVNQIGICGLDSINKFSDVILHAHTNGLAFNERSDWGISFNVWQKVWRLLGIDHLQINGIDGKYWQGNDSVMEAYYAMTQPFGHLSATLPVFCSGQWGGQVPETYNRTGKSTELMYLGGGGIHGHPLGAQGGVKAIRQAWDSCISDQNIYDYAVTHPELSQALSYFSHKAKQ